VACSRTTASTSPSSPASFGLLGPNGAGKTTLVKQIIGLLKPTEGSIYLEGTDLIDKPAIARQLCSFLPQG
jgi:ABC-type multidrug transport system ATPase subunit